MDVHVVRPLLPGGWEPKTRSKHGSVLIGQNMFRCSLVCPLSHKAVPGRGTGRYGRQRGTDRCR